MSRLAALERVLFYPTPMEIAELILSNIEAGGVGDAFDPCCGDGSPLALIGKGLGLKTYGSEIHPGRAAEAAKRLDHVVVGAREFLMLDGLFDVLLDNPPYDRSIAGRRMEIEHVLRDLNQIEPEGLAIFIIPETSVSYELIRTLVNHLENIAIRRFPAPAYDRFKQVVIFGNRRSWRPTYAYDQASNLAAALKEGLPTLKAGEFSYTYLSEFRKIHGQYQPIKNFTIQFPEISTVLEQVESAGVQTSGGWKALFGHGSEAGLKSFQPILALSPGHAAFMLAAGVIDGAELAIDGRPHLIKGSTEKRGIVSTSTEVAADGNVDTIIRERERLVYQINILDLTNGGLTNYNSLDDNQAFTQFLIDHQAHLVRVVEEKYKPLFNPDEDMPLWAEKLAKIHAPGILPGRAHLPPGLLPQQQIVAAALAKRLKESKHVILVGEMGVGKSSISMAVLSMQGSGPRNWRNVVVTPPQVREKWQREASVVLAEFDPAVHIMGERRRQADGQGGVRKIARPILDVDQAMATPNRPAMLITSYETAKNSARWVHAPARIRRHSKRWINMPQIVPIDHDPHREVRTISKEVWQTEEFLGCPDCHSLLYNDEGPLKNIEDMGRTKRYCLKCGNPLWQQTPFKYGGRAAVAHYLNKHYSNQYSLIIDEVHTGKGRNTDAGFAMADLISGANKVIAMTGTLYSGKGSSIFYLLHRLSPEFRALYEFDEVERFVDHHGLRETITRVRDTGDSHSAYGYNRRDIRVRETPGVTPGLVSLLLPNTAFIRLADLGMHLPDYREERLPVPLDERLESGLETLKQISNTARKLAREGMPGLLAAWLHASLGWVDCPVSETLIAKDRDGNKLGAYPIEGILPPDETSFEPLLAKDEALLNLVADELAKGRGCAIFFAQVNRRDWMERIHKLLEARGIYSEILRRNTCKPEEREAWYQAFVKRCRARGQEPILLANGNLVREGLDLIELPTIIETGVEYRINFLIDKTDKRHTLLGWKDDNLS